MIANNSLWNEKYRPTTLDNYIGNEHLKGVMAKYIATNDMNNMIFYGPAGTGKTTLAKLLVKNLNCDYLYINSRQTKGVLRLLEIKYQDLLVQCLLNPLRWLF
jgi:replication factor C small subunit